MVGPAAHRRLAYGTRQSGAEQNTSAEGDVEDSSGEMRQRTGDC